LEADRRESLKKRVLCEGRGALWRNRNLVKNRSARAPPRRSQSRNAPLNAKADRHGPQPFLSSDRLASLSDTMFGVAMTLVATSLLPSVQNHKGSPIVMLRDMTPELSVVVFSFIIAARYWISQQQRLAMTASITPKQTLLHLIFLFLIVLIPISMSIPGIVGIPGIVEAKQEAVVIYGAHLMLIALANLLLWIEVHRSVAAHLQIVRSSLALAVFVAALAVGAVWPYLALYLWLSVFATQRLGPFLARRVYGK
jgi:uncharacterized membrane protein